MVNNRKLPILCSGEDCTGCSACYNTCRLGAIIMIRNEEGYYNPSIDSNTCVGCGQCEKVCPVLNAQAGKSEATAAYCGWARNDLIRKLSSSGGAFSEFAGQILARGGIVWGGWV